MAVRILTCCGPAFFIGRRKLRRTMRRRGVTGLSSLDMPGPAEAALMSNAGRGTRMALGPVGIPSPNLRQSRFPLMYLGILRKFYTVLRRCGGTHLKHDLPFANPQRCNSERQARRTTVGAATPFLVALKGIRPVRTS